MMPEKMLICRENRFDVATVETGLGGAFTPTLPLELARDDDMSLAAEFASADPADTQVHLDFGATVGIGVVAVLRHTFPQETTLRGVFSNAADRSAPVLDQTWDLWELVKEYGLDAYEEQTYDGRLDPDVAALLGKRSGARLLLPVAARYCSLYFDVGAGAGAARPRMARLVVGPVHRPAWNLRRGWSSTIVDPRETRGRRLGRTHRLRGEERYRRLTFELPVTEAERIGFWQLNDVARPDGCALVWVFPDRPEVAHDALYYGELLGSREMPEIGHRKFLRSETLEEVM